ncbi:hypothetical protein LSH36_922g02033 [Paralvinella palmiformis]|uniref:Uncharacterized protein n=1 Tax=Paralvinella palmiformis TaxID=53620 RepID=A0AAD9MSP4_9ANNE|nr:hypothetical protein LSH36_922g02033 [Paralvinella palmiformis]
MDREHNRFSTARVDIARAADVIPKQENNRAAILPASGALAHQLGPHTDCNSPPGSELRTNKKMIFLDPLPTRAAARWVNAIFGMACFAFPSNGPPQAVARKASRHQDPSPSLIGDPPPASPRTPRATASRIQKAESGQRVLRSPGCADPAGSPAQPGQAVLYMDTSASRAAVRRSMCVRSGAVCLSPRYSIYIIRH